MKIRKNIVILLTICFGALTGCSPIKETVPDVPAPSETTVSKETVEADVTVKTQESTADDSDVPYVVLEEAEAWTIEEYEYYKEAAADNNYIDWRIESREHCYTYEDFEGMILQIFRFNIEFLSDTPENVVLIGGMSMTEDGWVVPNYANSRYLVFRQDGESLVFLTRMFENDCQPGDEVFTDDLKRRLAEKQEED